MVIAVPEGFPHTSQQKEARLLTLRQDREKRGEQKDFHHQSLFAVLQQIGRSLYLGGQRAQLIDLGDGVRALSSKRLTPERKRELRELGKIQRTQEYVAIEPRRPVLFRQSGVVGYAPLRPASQVRNIITDDFLYAHNEAQTQPDLHIVGRTEEIPVVEKTSKLRGTILKAARQLTQLLHLPLRKNRQNDVASLSKRQFRSPLPFPPERAA